MKCPICDSELSENDYCGKCDKDFRNKCTCESYSWPLSVDPFSLEILNEEIVDNYCPSCLHESEMDI